MDDPLLGAEHNIDERVELFVNTSLQWAQRFRGAGPGGDVMFTMGSDFHYQALLPPSMIASLRISRACPAPRHSHYTPYQLLCA